LSGYDTLAQKAKRFIDGLPGKKGKDIPETHYDRIFNAASGITQSIWGRPPTPQQMQWLYDNGHHTPDKVQEQFNQLEHPHAHGMTIGEYPRYSEALDVYRNHR